MKLEKVIISNFRSYQNTIKVDFNSITTLIGKNDIGKSTILEALEIFFNNSTVKISQKDACVKSTDKKVTIGCIFSGFSNHPESIVLDATNKTSLKAEYLLNEEGLLEIHKVFDCAKKTPTEEVFIKAMHPKVPQSKHLIQLTQTELKKIVKELKIDDSEIGDNRVNADYRKAIFKHYSDSTLDVQMISLSKNESKSIWEKIKLELPFYSLFQSDRTSSDGDSEVQDPMKLAIKEALAEVEQDLDKIKEKIEQQTMGVALETLEKLREMDSTLADSLVPTFSEDPKWAGIFKLSIEDSDGIPINKRGSGVRRLILLNFFRAAAERKIGEGNKKNIIYAIEEPETAQHPNNQRMLAEALSNLARNENIQVIVTTHVPNFAGLMPSESIRYIDLVGGEKVVKNAANDEGVLEEVVSALGMIASPIDTKKVKVAVVVEGPHDIKTLKIFSEKISENNSDIVNLNTTDEVVFIISGGSSLKYWVENQYLKSFGIPEVHLVDRDDESPPKYQKWCDRINERFDDSIAFMTTKREMENYIHPRCIKDHFGMDTEILIDDTTDVPEEIKKFNGMKHSTAKQYLNNEVARMMSYSDIKQMDVYNEIENTWLKTISNYVNAREEVTQ